MLLEYIVIILLALSPGIEARGAYPLAFYLGLSDPLTFTLIYVSSTLPSIPIVYGLRWVEEKILTSSKTLSKLYIRVLSYVRRRAERVSRYRVVYAGLSLYVAIPLPLTGVWTGSLISYLLGLDKRKSLIAIALGNLVACTIIYLVLLFPGLWLK